MQITPGTTINSDTVVTRQTLKDLWENGTPGQVNESDLASTVLMIVQGDSAPSEAPGKVWVDTHRELLFYYCDEYDDTGVSLWLAWGPDRLEVPLLATEHVPPGAAVTFTETDKKVRLVGGPTPTPKEARLTMGFNQDEDTAPSGTWFRGGVQGVLDVWIAKTPGDTGNLIVGAGTELGSSSDNSSPAGALWTNAGGRNCITATGISPRIVVNDNVQTVKALFLGPTKEILNESHV